MGKDCPKCNNKLGFSFGTCSSCGWNYIDSTYHWIKVNVNDLSVDTKEYLIRKYANPNA